MYRTRVWVRDIFCGVKSAQIYRFTDRRIDIIVSHSLFCAATLHRFGLPVDFARLNAETLPEIDVLVLQGTPMGLGESRFAPRQNLCLAVPSR